MASLANKDLDKPDRVKTLYNKVIDKKPFILVGGKSAKLKFNKLAEVMKVPAKFKRGNAKDIEDLKNINKDSDNKFIFTDGKKDYKFTDLEKTIEFGSTNQPSGGGVSIGNTATTESLQCYYNSLRYKLATELNSKNATEDKLTNKSLDSTVHVYDKSKRLKAAELILNHRSGSKKKQENLGSWIDFDNSGQNVYTRTANALATNQKWPGDTHFHRGSPFMKACYEAKNLALAFDKTLKQDVRKAPAAGYSDDKWNPGDIWMSTLNPDPKTSHPLDFGEGGQSCNLTFEALKDAVYEKAINKELLGVSLKKATGTPKVSQFNLPKRIQNVDVKLSGFRFGQTGDFFSSSDVYLLFNNNKEMQFRSFDGTKSWQGEVKGASAAGGKIGGGGVNFYCSDILKSPIGGKQKKDALKWSETKWNDSLFTKFYNLYETYSKHNGNKKKLEAKELVDKKTFMTMANTYKNRKGQNAAGSFKFSKYMGLLLLDAIYTGNSSKRNFWATKVLRYAMSNIDISSYFIKIE